MRVVSCCQFDWSFESLSHGFYEIDFTNLNWFIVAELFSSFDARFACGASIETIKTFGLCAIGSSLHCIHRSQKHRARHVPFRRFDMETVRNRVTAPWQPTRPDKLDFIMLGYVEDLMGCPFGERRMLIYYNNPWDLTCKCFIGESLKMLFTQRFFPAPNKEGYMKKLSLS